MTEKDPVAGQPGRLLAFEPGLIIPPMREPVTATQILLEEETVPRQDSSLEEIQISMLEVTGNMMPDMLIEQLGFEDFRWQLLKKHNGLAAIFLGSPHITGNIALQQALGVVEVRSAVRPITKVSRLYEPTSKKIVPGDINITGITKDNMGQDRAVRYHYELSKLEERSQAFISGASVSVSNDEFPAVTYDLFVHDIVDDFRRASELIPSEIQQYGYRGEGVITQAQVDHTAGHTHAIRLDGYGRNQKNLWFGLYYFTDYPNPGFSVSEHGESIILSYDTERRVGNHQNLPVDTPSSPSWEIEIQRQLSN